VPSKQKTCNLKQATIFCLSNQQNFILKKSSEVVEGVRKCALSQMGGGQAK
jgi:hypothetical protein